MTFERGMLILALRNLIARKSNLVDIKRRIGFAEPFGNLVLLQHNGVDIQTFKYAELS